MLQTFKSDHTIWYWTTGVYTLMYEGKPLTATIVHNKYKTLKTTNNNNQLYMNINLKM